MFHTYRVGFLVALGVALLGNPTMGANTYSTSFEDFSLGPISSGGTAQNGWSGGAQPDFTNSDAGDEQIVSGVSHTGLQAWHYARGYNSPGQGTPYTPNLDSAVMNVGDSLIGSFWFKAHTPGDNSLLAIETGNIAGNDRAEIIAYIENVPGGLTIRSFTDGAFTNVPIATSLDASAWHQLSFSYSLTSMDSEISISINGGSPVNFSGSLTEWREDNMFGYTESSRLKFRSRHLDGDLSFNGFYIDDISYSISAVPEPGSIALALVGLAGGSIYWRNRRK